MTARPAPAGRAVVVGAVTIAGYAVTTGTKTFPSCRTCSGIHRAECAQVGEIASPRHRNIATGSESVAVIARLDIDGPAAP